MSGRGAYAIMRAGIHSRRGSKQEIGHALLACASHHLGAAAYRVRPLRRHSFLKAANISPRPAASLVTPNHISDADPPTVGRGPAPRLLGDGERRAVQHPCDGQTDCVAARLFRSSATRRIAPPCAAPKTCSKPATWSWCFPKAKLSQDGKLQPILPGVLLIAERAKVAIVPTAIIGSDKLMPYGENQAPAASREKIIVRFGPPVTVEELKGGGRGGDALKRGAERLGTLMQAVQDNKPYPPAPPPPLRRAPKAKTEIDPAPDVPDGGAEADTDTDETTSAAPGQSGQGESGVEEIGRHGV